MTDWRCLTLRQPWAWAVCHAGKDVENRGWPVPSVLLDRPCERCRGHGRDPDSLDDDEWYAYPCDRCSGSGREPLRVMIHAGIAWDGSLGKTSARARWATLPDGTHLMSHRRTDDELGRWWVQPARTGPQESRQPFGAVVAVCTITDCHQEDYLNDPSPWAQFSERGEPYIYHWLLGDVTVLPAPVPVKGRQRLWTPDPDIVAAVEAQLAEADR